MAQPAGFVFTVAPCGEGETVDTPMPVRPTAPLVRSMSRTLSVPTWRPKLPAVGASSEVSVTGGTSVLALTGEAVDVSCRYSAMPSASVQLGVAPVLSRTHCADDVTL